MSLFSGIVSILSGGFVKDVGDAIDRNVTSDEERMALTNELAEIEDRQKERLVQFGTMIEENVTERHKADMQSDSWLAKNIRPLTLVVLTVATLGYAFLGLFLDMDQGSYKAMVFDAGLQAFIALDMVVYGFYFGSRGIEKTAGKVAEAFAKVRSKKQPEQLSAWDN